MSKNENPKMLNDDLNTLNEEARKQTIIRHKWATRQTAIVVGKAVIAAAVCWGLNYIGFISDLFLTILVSGCALGAAFLAGMVWGTA